MESQSTVTLLLTKPLPTSIIGVQCNASPDGRGVLVTAMNQDGLGYAAGVRVGDKLLSVNGELCTSPAETASMLREAEGALHLELVFPPPAPGKPLRRAAGLAQAKALTKAVTVTLEVAKATPASIIGVQCEFGPDGLAVIVSSMDPDALGYDAGVRVGDQMVSVNGERCTSPEQTASLLKEAAWTVAIEVVQAQAEPPAANKRSSFSKFGRNSFSPGGSPMCGRKSKGGTESPLLEGGESPSARRRNSFSLSSGSSPLGNRARRTFTGSFNSLSDIESTSPTSRWLSAFDQLSVNATLQASYRHGDTGNSPTHGRKSQGCEGSPKGRGRSRTLPTHGHTAGEEDEEDEGGIIDYGDKRATRPIA